MPKSAVDIGVILLLILPGFLVYSFATARRADPATKSPLWQLSEILQYSVYVHLLGVGLTFALLYTLSRFGIESHIDELPRKSLIDFLDKHFIEGILLVSLYPMYVVFAAAVMGAYDTPRKATELIVKCVVALTTLISSVPLLGWVQPPHPAHPKEPIWYLAFHTVAHGFADERPRLLVKMKQGGIYLGYLASYPIVTDDQHEKIF
ncbi:MAG: hypothetical protein IIC24_02440 [Chloroflexi bacterium]|nr:hypothetical protein [Chloroflexota bacterium]